MPGGVTTCCTQPCALFPPKESSRVRPEITKSEPHLPVKVSPRAAQGHIVWLPVLACRGQYWVRGHRGQAGQQHNARQDKCK